MPIYIYNAKKGPAETVSGEMEAASPEQVIVKLEEMGLVPDKDSGKGWRVRKESRLRESGRSRLAKPQAVQ